MARKKKLRPKLHVTMYKGEFRRAGDPHKEFEARGYVRQLSNDNYVQPAYMIDTYPGLKYGDGTETRDQWILQGAKLIILTGGMFLLDGFTTEGHHNMDDQGHFYRTEVAFEADALG
jgi:hypothetical protein